MTHSQPGTSPIFFVHIPKTAGTSLRVAAEYWFGNDAVEKNYGADSPDTTPLVREWILDSCNYPVFYKEICAAGRKFYTGHIKAFPAATVFPILRIATILRNPFEQAVSHYNHCARHHGYADSFDRFVLTRGNQQVYPLRGVPIQMLGFVGITERYAESLNLFNQIFGANLTHLNANVNSQKKLQAPDAHIRRIVEKYYPLDIRLYHAMNQALAQRHTLNAAGKPWCHGAIRMRQADGVSGYACWAEDDAPVKLLLRQGDATIAETLAVHPESFFGGVLLPRAGKIGFRFETKNIADTSRLRVVVASTGQLLDDELLF